MICELSCSLEQFDVGILGSSHGSGRSIVQRIWILENCFGTRFGLISLCSSSYSMLIE